MHHFFSFFPSPALCIVGISIFIKTRRNTDGTEITYTTARAYLPHHEPLYRVAGYDAGGVLQSLFCRHIKQNKGKI